MADLQAALERHIELLVAKVDIETTGLKKFIKMLGKEMDMNLLEHKDFIRECLTEAIGRLQKANQASEAEEDSDDEEEVKAPKKKGKGGGGLAARKEISPKLAAFLGKGSEMARTDIVKSLWEYIREHNLQNPENKREIFLDEAMKDVFGCDTFTMFTMNKYIGAHIDPFKPVDLTSSPTKRKRKTPAKKGGKDKKKRKTGSQPPYRLSEELQAVVGQAILPRPQVVSKIWEYIKGNDLQNPSDKREILCDEKLQAVMKKSKVSMFKMNQLITPHMLEKMDRSSYDHPQVSDQDSIDDE